MLESQAILAYFFNNIRYTSIVRTNSLTKFCWRGCAEQRRFRRANVTFPRLKPSRLEIDDEGVVQS